MVQIGFYALSAFMFFAVWYIVGSTANTDASQKTLAGKRYLIWSAVWLIYLMIISAFDIIHDFSMPPRIPLLIIAPVMISIILFNRTNNFGKQIVPHIPSYIPIYIQSFRIVVEILIYGAFTIGVLPQNVTFEGINFDILVGLTAPVVGLLHQRKIISKRLVLGWNILALTILGVTVYSFLSYFYFGGVVEEGYLAFGNMPFVLLPAFLLPCAIFFHILSIRQMMR